jgi:hypothetical protein
VSDDPGKMLRRMNTVKVPAVLVPEGGDAGEVLRAGISQPLRMRVRMQHRPGASGQSGGQQADNANQPDPARSDDEPTEAPASSGSGTSADNDPNIPVGSSGRPSMAPRRIPQRDGAS